MTFNEDLLRPFRIFVLSCLACVLLSGYGGAGTQDELYRRVQELASQTGETGSFDVALSDLTDFDWDEAVVFKYPASGKEMEEAVGVKYEGSLDLTYGIFFLKGKEIVYEELFPKDFDTRSKFIIYPHSGNAGREPHFGVFAPDSVFTCSVIESDQYTVCYTLKPVDLPGDDPA